MLQPKMQSFGLSECLLFIFELPASLIVAIVAPTRKGERARGPSVMHSLERPLRVLAKIVRRREEFQLPLGGVPMKRRPLLDANPTAGRDPNKSSHSRQRHSATL